MPFALSDLEDYIDVEGFTPTQRLHFQSRAGIIHYLANLEVKYSSAMSAGLFDNWVCDSKILKDGAGALKSGISAAIKDTSVEGKLQTSAEYIQNQDAYRAVASTAHSAKLRFQQVKRMIEEHIADALKDLLGQYKNTYGYIDELAQILQDAVQWIISSAVGSLTNLIPGLSYIQNTADLYKGIKQMVTGFKAEWTLHSAQKKITLTGHPRIIADSIKYKMESKGMMGAKNVAYKTLTLAATAAVDASSGAGAIVGWVAGAINRIWSAIDLFTQRFLLAKALKSAKEKATTTRDIAENSYDSASFNRWFSEICQYCPVLCALVVHSGAASQHCNFLTLVDRRDRIRLDAQEEVNNGVVYIETLKRVSKSYLKEYGDAHHVQFESSIKWQNSLLMQALDYKEPALKRRGGVRGGPLQDVARRVNARHASSSRSFQKPVLQQSSVGRGRSNAITSR